MRLRRPVLSFLLLTGLSLGVLSPARAAEDPTPVGPSATVEQGDDGAADATGDPLTVPADHEEAQAALGEVEDLFGPMTHAESRDLIRSGESKDATLALRDLSLRLGSLSRAERSSAYSEFQRPWWADSPALADSYCPAGGNICLHWIRTGVGMDSRATDRTWAIGTVYPDLMHVATTYAGAGYRTPRSDGGFGGSGQTDIYLDDVGSQGKYGYCTVDVNDTGHYVFHPSNSRASDLPAFCVLDNDYTNAGFRSHTPEDNLKVTAAHEYFHAVQFAYDYLEDRWFMEATATWAEDQVYDSINDNVQYLRASQLRYPGVSLDTYNGAGGFLHYGDWIYFAYLTQRSPARRGALPSLMLRMWQYADSVSGPDLYSVKAISSALAERHLSFNTTFAQYTAANRHPASAYSDGGTQRYYPTGRPKRTVALTPGKRTASGAYRVNHLASVTTRFVPRRLPSRHHRLTLTLDMANKRSGSVAEALVFLRNGRVATKAVRLNRSGNGRVRVPFSSRRVARVELVIVNANHAYRRCWVGTAYSCSGVPAQNQVKETFSARVS